jgi:uncharacterized protein YcfL
MKKFMFSSIAMIAFVGSSMANTSNVKENAKILLEKSCEEKAMDYIDNISGSDVEIHQAYVGYLKGCYDATKQKSLSLS